MSEFLQAAKPKSDERTGITLRDRFAIAAMQTMIAGGGYQKWEDISSDAYDIANAMIKEREK